MFNIHHFVLSVSVLTILQIFLTAALVPVIEDFIPITNRNRPGTLLSGILYITVHNTANTAPGANAKSHAKYVKNPSLDKSWHFTVDDHVIYQHLPTHEVGWHTGTTPGNAQSIGVEICENSDGNFQQAVRNAQELITKLMSELNVFKSRVVTHKYWSGKNCPRLLLKNWEEFLSGIGPPPRLRCFNCHSEFNVNCTTSPENQDYIVECPPVPGYLSHCIFQYYRRTPELFARYCFVQTEEKEMECVHKDVGTAEESITCVCNTPLCNRNPLDSS